MIRKMKIGQIIIEVEKDSYDKAFKINIENLNDGIVRLNGLPVFYVENSMIKFYKLMNDSSDVESSNSIKNLGNINLGKSLDGILGSLDLGESHVGNPF